MATKEHRRHAKGLIEGLETRAHVGPPIHATEIHQAREFLQRNDFSPASDYFNRLVQVQDLVQRRSPAPPPTKRNYGGEAAGCWMQLQSAYDHVILSTCYEGEQNCKSARVKISHRFNQAGRIDFVELKFLRSFHPLLAGEIRKLLLVKDFQTIRKDWYTAEAYVLAVLPRELVFLYEDIFRCPRHEMLAWLVNIGHRMVEDMTKDLMNRPANGHLPNQPRNGDQLCLEAVRSDEVAWPILESAADLECTAELTEPKEAVVRYGAQ